jgi:hypothetical protein
MFTATPTFWCMNRRDRPVPKLRYRAIRYPDGRYLPAVYDPRRIRVRGDQGRDIWASIEEGDIVARFKTYAEARIGRTDTAVSESDRQINLLAVPVRQPAAMVCNSTPTWRQCFTRVGS